MGFDVTNLSFASPCKGAPREAVASADFLQSITRAGMSGLFVTTVGHICFYVAADRSHIVASPSGVGHQWIGPQVVD